MTESPSMQSALEEKDKCELLMAEVFSELEASLLPDTIHTYSSISLSRQNVNIPLTTEPCDAAGTRRRATMPRACCGCTTERRPSLPAMRARQPRVHCCSSSSAAMPASSPYLPARARSIAD